MIPSHNLNSSFNASIQLDQISEMDFQKLSNAMNDIRIAFENLHDSATLLEQRNTLSSVENNSDQNAMTIINDIENGRAVASSGLSVEDEVIPPSGEAVFTKDERELKLKQMAGLSVVNQDKKIPSGCSVLLNIFGDKLRECFQKIQREPNSRHVGLKPIVAWWIEAVELMLAVLVSQSYNTGNFHTMVYIQEHLSNPELIRSQFLGVYQNIVSSSDQLNFTVRNDGNQRGKKATEVTANSIFNIIKNSKGCQELLETLILLKDFVNQEFHRLYAPLEVNSDLTYHFSRLSRRAINFSQVINGVGLFGLISKEIIRGYTKLINENNANSLKFCTLIIDVTKNLEGKTEQHKLKSCWISLESHRLSSQTVSITKELGNKLYLDGKKKILIDDPQFSRLASAINHLRWLHDTLLDETYIVLIDHLLKAGSVTNSEIDQCVESLIDAANLIKDFDISYIDKQLASLKIDNYVGIVLQNIWKEEFKNAARMHIFPAVIQHLKIRLQRCLKNPDDRIERIIMLRSSLHTLGEQLSLCTSQTDAVLANFKKKLDLKNEGDVKISEIYQEIQDFHTMQYDSLSAAIEAIKALIGRCFTEIDLRTQAVKKNNESDLYLKTESARKAQDELLQMLEDEQKQKSVKRNKGKKPAKKIPEKKPVEKIANIEISKTEEPYPSINIFNDTVEPFQFTSKKLVKDASFQKLKNLKESLFQCKNLAEAFKKSDLFAKPNWQINQLKNLEIFLERLIESADITDFSVDQIFTQIDLTRKSVEAILDITTIFIHTPLDIVRNMGHDTKSKTYFLVKDMSVPEAVRKVLWQLRQAPFMLAEANKCVNYPAESYANRRTLQTEGQSLINFLIQVDQEGNSLKQDEQLRADFIAEQKHLLNQAVYFMERMLSVVFDPSQLIEEALPVDFPETLFKNISTNDEDFSSDMALDNKTISNTVHSSNYIIPLSINNREQALSSLERALAWVAIRSIAPVEGYPSSASRKQERNIALKNCANYLRRLKEKLKPERSNTPMSTVLGQCELIRRIQKELHIAALYHGNHFKDGQPIVKALDIRYENSPNVLMNILHNVSAIQSKLPFVGEWLHPAHRTLSYPNPLNGATQTFSSSELQLLIKKAHKKAQEMNQVSNNETLILSQGKKKSPEKRCQERIKLVEDNEKQKIYPEIATILHILKHGLTIPKHAHL